MELSKSYLDDFFLIGNMYGIPRDVLEAYQSSTFENQEKARASHVSYCMDPAGEDLATGIHDFFKMPENESLVISWDHLPFVQVFEKDRELVKREKIANFEKLVRMGMTIEEANRFCDTDFEEFELKANEQRTGQAPRDNSESENIGGSQGVSTQADEGAENESND
jgi:hypothetical protein